MAVNSKDRAELIRKGNALFNEGKFDLAARIFETVQYGDGLIRIGDHFYARNDITQALIYYKKARYTTRIRQMAPNIASVFKMWLSEDKDEKKDGQ